MRRYSSVYQVLPAGAAAGLLAFVMVVRLNPEAEPGLAGLALGLLLWMSWGVVWAGLPCLLLLTVVARARRRERTDRWWTPELMMVVFVIAGVMSRLNAEIHPEFLSGTAHRMLAQDAVIWLVCGLAVLGGGIWLRRRFSVPWVRVALTVAVLGLPAMRLAVEPSPPRHPVERSAQPLGDPTRPLLVVGLEGLDAKVLLTHAVGSRFPAFDRLVTDGAWGPLRPYRPYLRRSLWTTTATGVYPRLHGVKSRWAWHLPSVFPVPLRLLPWPQQGSQWTLPWGLVRRGDPEPSAVPALWGRLRASGLATSVLEWPGVWNRDSVTRLPETGSSPTAAEPELVTSLMDALQPFARHREAVLEVVTEDRARFAAARAGLSAGARNVWIHSQSLAVVRRHLEPLHADDSREREVLDLVLEFLDRELADLLAAVPAETLVAVLSPYGLEPPDSWERILRLLGVGRQWRATARTCPDGALLVLGDGVIPGGRFSRARLPDVAPTLCYLVRLPVAQYMEGRVIVDAMEPVFLATHPLRVVD